MNYLFLTTHGYNVQNNQLYLKGVEATQTPNQFYFLDRNFLFHYNGYQFVRVPINSKAKFITSDKRIARITKKGKLKYECNAIFKEKKIEASNFSQLNKIVNKKVKDGYLFSGENDNNIFKTFLYKISGDIVNNLTVSAPQILSSDFKKVIYIDYDVNWSNPTQDVLNCFAAEYTHVILCFLIMDGTYKKVQATDVAMVWTADFTKLVKKINPDKKIMISFGGANVETRLVYDNFKNNVYDLAAQILDFCNKANYDGVDLDLELISPAMAFDADFRKFLIDLSNQLKNPTPPQLEPPTKPPPGAKILSHAPQSPYFGPWGNGFYNAIEAGASKSIDFYNIQFYNQGADVYTTCSTLYIDSGIVFPYTSVSQIINGEGSSGKNTYHPIPYEKVLIGKPIGPTDASNGYMTPTDLWNCITTADGINIGGVMGWTYHNRSDSYCTFVQANSCNTGLSSPNHESTCA